MVIGDTERSVLCVLIGQSWSAKGAVSASDLSDDESLVTMDDDDLDHPVDASAGTQLESCELQESSSKEARHWVSGYAH